MGQSPLLDPHRRQEAGRDSGKVDDRRRYPKHTAPTRPEKAGPAAWNGDQGRGLSGQGRRTPGKRLNLTLSNGRALFLGSSDTGAPRDGADSTEGGVRPK